jgi:hypothetical protein
MSSQSTFAPGPREPEAVDEERDARDDMSAAPESGQPAGGRDETRDDRDDGVDPGDDL